jgi:putative transposase
MRIDDSQRVWWIGYPAKIRTDNGPKFASIALADWADEHDIEREFIQPGKPT